MRSENKSLDFEKEYVLSRELYKQKYIFCNFDKK